MVAARVAQARERARARGVPANAELSGRDLDEVAPLSQRASAVLESALASGRLSARGLRRVWRVALTIADLAEADGPLSAEHVAAALHLRSEPTFLVGRRAS